MDLWTQIVYKATRTPALQPNPMRFSSLLMVAMIAVCFSLSDTAPVAPDTPTAANDSIAKVPKDLVGPTEEDQPQRRFNHEWAVDDCPDEVDLVELRRYQRTHPAASGRRAGEDGEANNSVVPVAVYLTPTILNLIERHELNCHNTDKDNG